MNVLVIYGSTRRHGNSELLAESVIKEIPASRIYLAERRILPIVDQRHEPGGFTPTTDDLDELAAQMLAHQVLVFVTPLYWYGMSGLMKNFVDRWSQLLRDRRYTFAETMGRKTSYLLVTGGDDPRRKALPLVEQFGYICDYVGMTYGGYIVGEGNKPGDVLSDQRALADAAILNAEFRQLVSDPTLMSNRR